MFKIFVITLLNAIGDTFLKKSSGQSHIFFNRYFIVGLVIYMIAAFLWTFAYKYLKFSTSVTIYSIFSIIIFSLIGVFFFKEKLNITEIIGILLAIVSLGFLARFN